MRTSKLKLLRPFRRMNQAEATSSSLASKRGSCNIFSNNEHFAFNHFFCTSPHLTLFSHLSYARLTPSHRQHDILHYLPHPPLLHLLQRSRLNPPPHRTRHSSRFLHASQRNASNIHGTPATALTTSAMGIRARVDASIRFNGLCSA